jgi:hypothetical protein
MISGQSPSRHRETDQLKVEHIRIVRLGSKSTSICSIDGYDVTLKSSHMRVGGHANIIEGIVFQ